MEWVVTTGRTVEEAKDAALDELGVDEADAEFEILEEPRQGLFGRARGEARVRARVRPTAPRPKLDRRDRRRRSRDRIGDDAKSGEVPTAPDVVVAPGSEHAAWSREGDPLVALPGHVDGAAASRQPGSAGNGGPRRRQGSPSDAGRATLAGSAPSSMDDEGNSEGNEEMDDAMTEDLSLAEQGEVARQFVVGLLERFGTDGDVSVADLGDGTLEVRVEGADLGLLIGPKGQTLAAVQELARTVVQGRMRARSGRLVVDVAGYRKRRREALERFTRQVAQDVVSSGVQKVLEPMSPPDRKVVHDTANEIPGVHTVSEGEEPRRRVVILPGPPQT